jgi:hypothetical protein
MNNRKIADLLIENSADEEALNSSGKTPWQCQKLQNKCEKPDVTLLPVEYFWNVDDD